MRPEELGFIIIVGVMVAFYLIFLRPLQQEQKRHRRDIQDLRPGDEVLTTSGFIARVKEIQVPEEGPVELRLELGPGLEVRALTSSIAQRIAPRKAPAPQEVAGGETKGV